MITPQSSMRIGLLFLALGSFAACQTADPYSKQTKRLGTAVKDLERSDFSTADRILGRLLVETEEESSDHVLQRFYAAGLLALDHAQASLGNGYLLEKKGAGLFGNGAEAVSPTAHLVATRFYGAYVGQWEDSAARAKSVVDGVDLLPSSLKNQSVKDVRRRTSYLEIYTLARLRFEQRLGFLLVNEKALTDFDFVKREMDELGVPEGAKPWIMLALFNHIKKEDTALAFKFGLTAFQDGRESIGTQDRLRYKSLEDWLNDPEPGKKLGFYCPSCPPGEGASLDPSAQQCGLCFDADSIDFQLREIPEGGT